jgi:hypothetical protein
MAAGAVVAHPADKYANATQPWMRYQPRVDTLTAYKPTMTQRIPDMVKDGLRALGLNKFAANAFGSPIADVLGYSPVGAVAQSWDAGQAAARAPGMFGKAAGLGGGMALAALGAVPGGKALARKGEALAMDEASRMARAAEQGFDTSRYGAAFHGTTADIAGFDNAKRGSVTGAKSAEQAHWLTSSPDTAGGYADHAAKRELHQTLRDWQTAMDKQQFDKADALMAKAEALESAAEASGQNVMPVMTRGNLMQHHADGATYGQLQDGGLTAILDKARSGGFDGVKFTGLRDDVGWGGGRPATHYAIFDPANIRSKFAAFDPAKRGSANLLAGLGLGGLGYGMVSGSSTDWGDPTQY